MAFLLCFSHKEKPLRYGRLNASRLTGRALGCCGLYLGAGWFRLLSQNEKTPYAIFILLHDIHPSGSLSTAGESQHAQTILGKFDPIERSQCCFEIETSSLLVLSFLAKKAQNIMIYRTLFRQQKQRIRYANPLKNQGF